MEHVCLTGLFLIFSFVSIYFFWHKINGTRQIEENWNPNKSRTAGGTFSSLHPLFGRVTPTFFLDSPEISPGVLITASATPSPSGGSSPNTGIIVGGVVGGVAVIVIAIAVVAIFFLRQRRVRASSDVIPAITEGTAPFSVSSAPQPMKQGRNALADNLTLGSLTTPDSPATSMGAYVSEFVSPFSTFLFIFSLPCTPRTQVVMLPRYPSLKIRMFRTSQSKDFSNSIRPQEIPLLICTSMGARNRNIRPGVWTWTNLTS